MNKKDFIFALDIISTYHSTELAINKPLTMSIGNLGSSEFTIGITKCCAGVINKLHDNQYMLSMQNDILMVNKI